MDAPPVNKLEYSKATQFVNKVYDGLSYYDMYGTTIMIFLLLTIFVVFVYGYFQIMRVREDIDADWQNQR